MTFLRFPNLIVVVLSLLLFRAVGVDASAPDFVGHVDMQTNEIDNRIMHFGRKADGQLDLLESIPTGGAGTGVFKPISGQESASNAFKGADSVILDDSVTLLIATNGGDNSATSLRVGPDGKPTVIDREAAGEPATGRTGTSKSLVYHPQSRTLYLLHAFGPNHLRWYTVPKDSKLGLRTGYYSVGTTRALRPPEGCDAPHLRTDREDWVLRVVADGRAICILPERSAAAPGLVTRPIEGLDLERELVMVTILGPTTPAEMQKIAQFSSIYEWR